MVLLGPLLCREPKMQPQGFLIFLCTLMVAVAVPPPPANLGPLGDTLWGYMGQIRDRGCPYCMDRCIDQTIPLESPSPVASMAEVTPSSPNDHQRLRFKLI